METIALITAVEILEYHQEWRKGKEGEMIHPRILSLAIDVVLEEVKRINHPSTPATTQHIVGNHKN